MERLVVLISSTIVGSVGWWIGARVGVMTAFLVSIVGTAIGVYLGRRFVQEYLP